MFIKALNTGYLKAFFDLSDNVNCLWNTSLRSPRSLLFHEMISVLHWSSSPLIETNICPTSLLITFIIFMFKFVSKVVERSRRFAIITEWSEEILQKLHIDVSLCQYSNKLLPNKERGRRKSLLFPYDLSPDGSRKIRHSPTLDLIKSFLLADWSGLPHPYWMNQYGPSTNCSFGNYMLQ